jgi:peptidylprolyl isomerase
VRYALRSEDGEVMDPSACTMPEVFTIGKGEAIPGLEKGIIDMKPGELKTITVHEADGYGPREERKVFEFLSERMPKDFDPRIGQVVQMHRPDGSTFSVKVIGRTDKGYTMDANHPCAGKTLVFDLKLLEIIQQTS